MIVSGIIFFLVFGFLIVALVSQENKRLVEEANERTRRKKQREEELIRKRDKIFEKNLTSIRSSGSRSTSDEIVEKRVKARCENVANNLESLHINSIIDGIEHRREKRRTDLLNNSYVESDGWRSYHPGTYIKADYQYDDSLTSNSIIEENREHKRKLKIIDLLPEDNCISRTDDVFIVALTKWGSRCYIIYDKNFTYLDKVMDKALLTTPSASIELVSTFYKRIVKHINFDQLRSLSKNEIKDFHIQLQKVVAKSEDSAIDEFIKNVIFTYQDLLTTDEIVSITCLNSFYHFCNMYEIDIPKYYTNPETGTEEKLNKLKIDNKIYLYLESKGFKPKDIDL